MRLVQLRDPLLPQLAEMAARHACARGLEMRHPLLDHRLVDFAARLPASQSFRAGVRKVILRNAMSGDLPEEVSKRRTKVYPTALAHLGLREKETAKVWRLLEDMRCADLGLVDPDVLRDEYRTFVEGRHNRSLFWYALTLEDWLRRYF
jgi:asparagine synthase (glutamine-hydrolysing)